MRTVGETADCDSPAVRRGAAEMSHAELIISVSQLTDSAARTDTESTRFCPWNHGDECDAAQGAPRSWPPR